MNKFIILDMPYVLCILCDTGIVVYFSSYWHIGSGVRIEERRIELCQKGGNIIYTFLFMYMYIYVYLDVCGSNILNCIQFPYQNIEKPTQMRSSQDHSFLKLKTKFDKVVFTDITTFRILFSCYVLY